MVIVAIPAEEFRVVTMLQDELLASEVRVIKADPGSTLHTDGVHSVHKATVLEVVTVPKHLQLPPCEVLALIESDLERRAERSGAGDSPLLDPNILNGTQTSIPSHYCGCLTLFADGAESEWSAASRVTSGFTGLTVEQTHCPVVWEQRHSGESE